MENKTIKKKRTGKIALSLLAVFFIVAFSMAFYRLDQMNKLESFKSAYGALATDLPNYKLVNSQTYVKEGKQCIAYRVVVKPNLSNDDLCKVFYHTCNDNYSLHTVWFYSSQQKSSGQYDIAMLDESDRSKWPEISRVN